MWFSQEPICLVLCRICSVSVELSQEKFYVSSPLTSCSLSICFLFLFLKIGLDDFNLGKQNLKNTIFFKASNSLFNRGYDRGNDF